MATSYDRLTAEKASKKTAKKSSRKWSTKPPGGVNVAKGATQSSEKGSKGSKGASASKAAKSGKAAKGGKAAKSGTAAKSGRAAKASGKRARAKAAAPALTTAEKQRLLKPLTGFGDLVNRLSATWKAHGRSIKVPGLSPASLASKLRRAQKAAEREDTLRATLTAKLQPLADARLRAEHDAWKSALDLYAMVKTAARADPALSAPFEFFSEAFANRKATSSEPAGEGGADDAGDSMASPLRN